MFSKQCYSFQQTAQESYFCYIIKFSDNQNMSDLGLSVIILLIQNHPHSITFMFLCNKIKTHLLLELPVVTCIQSTHAHSFLLINLTCVCV